MLLLSSKKHAVLQRSARFSGDAQLPFRCLFPVEKSSMAKQQINISENKKN
jgi:hypothetical protein